MPKVEIGLTSFFPRPEELVSATRELDRGRRSPAEVDRLFEKWTDEVLRIEGRLGFAWKTGGHLPWQDLFRPLLESTQGMVAGPLTRWFETNTFYRRLVVEETPRPIPGALPVRFPQGHGPLAPILPGPYTLSGLAENRTSLDDVQLDEVLASLLADEVRELARSGMNRFLFHEPLLAARPPAPSEEDRVRRLYEPLRAPLASAQSLLWTYFGDGAPILPLLTGLPVGGIGVDLADTRPSAIHSFPREKALGLGCLDARTSLPEDPRDIAGIVKELGGRLSLDSVVLGPGVPLDLLPWEAALRKVEVLPAVQGSIEGR